MKSAHTGSANIYLSQRWMKRIVRGYIQAGKRRLKRRDSLSDMSLLFIVDLRSFGLKYAPSVANALIRAQTSKVARKRRKSRANPKSRAQTQKVARKPKKSRANPKSRAQIEKANDRKPDHSLSLFI